MARHQYPSSEVGKARILRKIQDTIFELRQAEA
ncbi:hypothetical protein SS1G_03218 [Sclerotinia sclerotiorum 1980 UF-70]|uniref:Uncharacterized protein n=1 Tax=Sclerotinia sclerotiorum (strain ATCC 18683 / 1980 / Ss-1) TaxID=665079 RepID=A7ED29_SCLS1|nr:hypothetical protein SS1G_03218 [Sclerotinia sclerotiorum 1980 UF-70]EDO00745.1 hypothetical protein SS1G_03218 [Sclerotinia sclerotiorum 1980 UF-70]